MDANNTKSAVGRPGRQPPALHPVLTLLRERPKMTTTLTEKRTQTDLLTDRSELQRQIEDVVNTTPVIDVHTHVFPPEFDGMFRFGIDELLTYHYLIVETFRS